MMALVRWEPFGGLTSLRREMDHLLEDFEDVFGRGLPARRERVFEPAVEVSNTKDAAVMKA